MSPRLLLIALCIAPTITFANPVFVPRPPASPPAPGLTRVQTMVLVKEDPVLNVDGVYAAVRIPRGRLLELLGRETPKHSRSSWWMLITAGVSLSAAAIAAGLVVRSRMPKSAAIILLLACLVNGTGVFASALQSATGSTAPEPEKRQPLRVSAYLNDALLETFDANEDNDYIQIRVAPSPDWPEEKP